MIVLCEPIYIIERNVFMSRKIKINKGAVLFALLLIGIISYLVGLSIVRGQDEADIKKLCTDYIAIETQLNMLPEKYRTSDPQISAAELQACIQDMKDTVKLYFIDNENAYTYLTQSLERSLTQQAGGGSVLIKFNKSVISFDGFSYRDGLVNVQIHSQMSYEYETDGESRSDNGIVSDEMTVQKVDGKWKVVYSNLSTPDGTVYNNTESFIGY